MSLLDRDHYPNGWLERVEALERRVQDLERSAKTGAATMLQVDTTDVSNPPTDAQLDAIFGTPGTVGAGFTAIVNDAAGSTSVWLVWSDGASWWYEQGTKAV